MRAHHYNLRSKPTEQYWRDGMSEIYGADDITPLDIDEEDAGGDYFECDSNSNLVPRSRSVSALKRSIEERNLRQQSMSYKSGSASELHSSKERILRNPLQYYHAKLSSIWWRSTDYLVNDLFNYYNKVMFCGFLLVLLVLFFAHLALQHVLLTEAHRKQFSSSVDNFFYWLVQRNWSPIPAQIGPGVPNVF